MSTAANMPAQKMLHAGMSANNKETGAARGQMCISTSLPHSGAVTITHLAVILFLFDMLVGFRTDVMHIPSYAH